MTVRIEFCGERYRVEAGNVFTIGREADLVLDENLFLHRRFLRIHEQHGLWWLANVGSQLSATIADSTGVVQAWLAPGAQIPLVFPACSVWFTAGPTTYEIELTLGQALFSVLPPDVPTDGSTTYGRTSLTPEQRLLLIALAEPVLNRKVRGAVDTPTSAEAASRLGWTLTKFNRKLDNVCRKLELLGVQGLHGGPDRLATSRKSRLVEYALAARLVTEEDLPLLGSN